jgi:hypothetical protein
MSTSIVNGYTTWSASRDEEGQRTYKIKFLIKGVSTDGPATVLQTEGLPVPGSIWDYGNDIDIWATCKLAMTVTPVLSKEQNQFWDVECTFSTKSDSKRCMDQSIENPLLIPDRISGSFKPVHEEQSYDRDGSPILNSAFEMIRGPKVEFDKFKATVKIEQNVPSLQLPLLTSMVDTVNDSPLWGIPARCIKMNLPSWERKFWGLCNLYYTRTLEFEIDWDTFDRDILDEGTKALFGRFDKITGLYTLTNIAGQPPNLMNPNHFDKFLDRAGNPTRTLLNGAGLPAGVATSQSPYYISIENNNVNNDLSNGTFWIQVVGSISNYPPWDQEVNVETGYFVGQIVTDQTLSPLVWICTQDTGVNGAEPGVSVDADEFWTALIDPDDTGDQGLVNSGIWNTSTTYTLGDYVIDPKGDNAGNIHVEYYDESNFLLLGIPITLDTLS